MKKFLVVLIAISLVLAFSATAFAADTQIASFSDISTQSQAAQVSIMKLAALGVLTGDKGLGGAYRPADTLTRAEFCKIAVYLAGKDGSVSALASSASIFKDVAKGAWYTGYVNVAQQNGMIKGYADGTFKPNATITYAEASTILLRSVGYDDHLSGSWPANYLGKGQEIGLFDDAAMVNDAAVTRADMAVMGSNCLGLNVVKYVENEIAQGLGSIYGDVDADGYSEVYYYTNEDKNKKENVTLLYRSFDALQFEGDVFEVAPEDDLEEAYGWSYSDYEDGQLVFVLQDFEDLDLEDDDDTYDIDVADSYYIYGGSLGNLSSQVVNLIVNDDDEVLFAEITSTTELISEFEGSDDTCKTTITADDKKIKYTTDEDLEFLLHAPDCAINIDGTYGKVYLDEDGRWYALRDYADYEDYGFGYVDDVDDEYITFNDDTAIEDIAIDEDLDDYNDYKLLKDGKFIAASDVKAGDVIYESELADGTALYVVKSAVSGDITNYKAADGYKIAGTYYGVLADTTYSSDGGDNFVDLATNKIASDDFGTVNYVPAYAFTQLAAVVANAEDTTIYGVVTGVTYTSSWSEEGEGGTVYDFTGVTIFNADGEKVTYDFEDDFADDYAQNDLRKGDMVELTVNEDGDVTEADVVVEFNGEDIDLTAAGADDYDVTADNDTDRLIWTDGTKKSYKLTADTEIFLVSSDDGAYDDVEIQSISSALANDFDCRYIYVYDNTGNVANTIYILDSSEGDAEITPCAFFTDYEADGDGYFFTTIDDEKVYVEDGDEYVDGELDGYDFEDCFVIYETDNDEIVNGSIVLVVSDAGLATLTVGEAADLAAIIEGTNNSTAAVATGAVTAAGSGSITVGGVAYNVDSNTFMYAYENQLASGSNDAGEVTRLANFAGAQQVVIIYDTYANDALYIFAY